MLKRILPLLGLLLFFARPASATWTLVQNPSNAACASATSCAVTLTQAVGNGNVLVILGDFFAPTGTPSITAISAGGTFAHPACDVRHSVTENVGASCGYVLSSTATAGPITVTYTNGNATSGDVAIAILEYHSTAGPGVFDTASTVDDAASTSPPGVALTLAGAGEVVAQCLSSAGTASAITSPYTSPAIFPSGYGFAGSINTASGAAPTWTTTNHIAVGSALAFKETSGAVVRHRASVINQ